MWNAPGEGMNAAAAGSGGGHALCVGVSPNIQRTMRFAHLRVGEVNRATSIQCSASGKGTNVHRILSSFGCPTRLTGFVGEENAGRFTALLTEDGLTHDLVSCNGPTRYCQTLIGEHDGVITEIVDEAPTPEAAAWQRLDEAVDRHLAGASLLLLSGKLPPGSPPDVYARWVRMAREHGAAAFIDTQGEPLVHAMREQPLLVKINAEELALTFHQAADDEAVSLEEGIRRLLDAGVGWVAVTRGHRPAFLVGPEARYRVGVPEIEVVNPIGSGDATLAGIAAAWRAGSGMPEAFRRGIAAGSANAMTDTSGVVDPSVAESLIAQVELTEL